MSDVTDSDPRLAALLDDLRVRLAALNQLHHPVYGGDPRLIREQERQVESLRNAIRSRRRELAGPG